MPPTDDNRARILGKVQALRSELGQLRDQVHGREIKRRIDALYQSVRLEGWYEHANVAIVIAFRDEARATMVRMLGTSAWDEPETQSEGDARQPVASGVGFNDPAKMASPFQKPANEGSQPLTDVEL